MHRICTLDFAGSCNILYQITTHFLPRNSFCTISEDTMYRKTLLTLTIALMMIVVIPAQAQDTTISDYVLSEELAWQHDAEHYVKAFGGTIEEAVSRLKLQEEIAILDAKLQYSEASVFGGLWIEHTPAFRIVVQLTHGGKEVISPYIQDKLLIDVVSVERSELTLADLQFRHANAIDTLQQTNQPFESAINVKRNRIEVYVTDPVQFQQSVTRSGVALSEHVEIIGVPALSAPAANWYAGLSTSGCTSGFTLQQSSTKYASIAAHCNPSAISPLPPAIVQFTGGAYDFSYHNAPSGDILRNWAVDNSNDATPRYRPITSFTARATLGTIVCKWGKTTSFTCGSVESNNYNYQGSPTWLLINSIDVPGTKIACPGDSGAPTYSGSIAIGQVTAVWCDPSYNKMVVMPVQSYLDAGFSPATN